MSDDATPTSPEPAGEGVPDVPSPATPPGYSVPPYPSVPGRSGDIPSLYPAEPTPPPYPSAGAWYPHATAPQYTGVAGPGYADTGATYGGMPPTGASGYQPVGAPYPPPHSHTTDGVSIAALVTGIIGTGPVALVLGIIGLRRTGAGRRGGRGFAIAGTVLGAVGILGWIVVGLFALFVWNTAHSVMDNYRTECADGDLYSCDSLYLMSGAGSDNEHFGNTCGERADSNQYGSCYRYDIDENGQLVDPWDTDDASTEADAYGDDPELDALWGACDAGDGDACNDLYFDSPVGSEYEEFGDTCGGRQEGGGWCS